MSIPRTLLILFATCVLTFAAKSNENSTKSGPRIFLISARMMFYAKNATTDERIGIATGDRIRPLYVDYHAARGALYFISQRSGFWTQNAKLYSLPWNYDFACDVENPYCKLEHNGKIFTKVKKMKLLREEENWNPRSLAVDYVADKLYIVNTGERSVNVFDLDGNNKCTVFENDTLIPLEVALDPLLGSMFVLAVNIQNGTKQIYKANMDGSNVQLIVEKVEDASNFTLLQKVGFTLDILNKQIYFGNFQKGAVERVDYEGKLRLTVANATDPVSIGIYNDTLYWSDSNSVAKYEYLCFKSKCQLFTCKLNINGTCTEDSMKPYQDMMELTYRFHAVKIVDKRAQRRFKNPCSENNGDCQHHCLLRSSTPGYSCVCRNGWRLADNQKNCREEEVKNVYVDALVSHTSTFSELYNSSDDRIILMPRHLLIHLMSPKPRMLFHAMPFRYFNVQGRGSSLMEMSIPLGDSMSGDREKDFVLSLLGVFTDSIDKPSEQDYDPTVLHRSQGYINPTLAYDWVNKNLYFVKLKKRGSLTGELSVLKYDDQKNSTDDQPKAPVIFLRTIDTPASLAVDPYRGYLFSVTSYGSIVRYNLDGSKKSVILSLSISNAKVVAVDLNEDAVYWLNSDGYVSRTNLNGTQPVFRLLWHRAVMTADVFYVFDQWLFIKSNDRIWRFDKATGKVAGNMGRNLENLYHESVGMKVSAEDARMTIKNACTVQNGGCQQFCFPLPRNDSAQLEKVCGCEKGYILLDDSLTCEEAKEEEDEELKPDIRTDSEIDNNDRNTNEKDLIKNLFIGYYKKLAMLTDSII